MAVDRSSDMVLGCLFFFQAEDGIRDVAVTGVQTCALPISPFGACLFSILYQRTPPSNGDHDGWRRGQLFIPGLFLQRWKVSQGMEHRQFQFYWELLRLH